MKKIPDGKYSSDMFMIKNDPPYIGSKHPDDNNKNINTVIRKMSGAETEISFDYDKYRKWLYDKEGIAHPDQYISGIMQILRKYGIKIEELIKSIDYYEKTLSGEISSESNGNQKHKYSNQRSALRKLKKYLSESAVPSIPIGSIKKLCHTSNKVEWPICGYTEEQLRRIIKEMSEGIISFAKELTKSGIDPLYAREIFERIIFKSRKKETTDWYDGFSSFVNSVNDETNGHFEQLIQTVDSFVKEALNANDACTHHGMIQPWLILLLEAIIGYDFDRGSSQFTDTALKYLNDIRQGARIIVVLSGEFIAKNPGQIILYLDNIKDCAQNNGYEFIDAVCATLSHEYFHSHHYYAICLGSVPEINCYNPGTIVKESLASWFECKYCEEKLHKQPMAQGLKDSWKTVADHYWDFWSYAGACLIRDKGHFAEVFNESLTSFFGAAKILGI